MRKILDPIMITAIISFALFLLFLGLIVWIIQEIVGFFGLPVIIVRVSQLVAGFIALLYLAQILGVDVGLPR